eukprot:g57427.t1
MFTVSTAANGYSRCFYMAAHDDQDRERWLSALAVVEGISTIGLGAKHQEASRKTGYLYKSQSGGGASKKGKKQWVVLLSDRLLLLKSEQDQTPEGVVLLPSGAQVNVLHGGDVSATFSVASSADEGEISHIFRAGSVEEMDDWIREISAVVPRGDHKTHADSLQEGYLQVKELGEGGAALISKWRKVYTVLLKSGIRYYRKRADQRPAHIMALDCAAWVVADNTGENNALSLYASGDEGEKPLEFKAEFTTLRDDWVSSMQRCIADNKQPLYPDSIKEGYLEKTGQEMVVWHKRFFVLFPDRLAYFKKRKSAEPTGVVELTGAAKCVVDGENGKDKEQPDAAAGKPETGTLNGGTPTPHTILKSGGAPSGEKLTFVVASSSDEGERSFFIRGTRDETLAWVTALRKTISSLTSRVHPGALREGYVKVKAGNEKRTRYLVLWDVPDANAPASGDNDDNVARLAWFKKRLDEEAEESMRVLPDDTVSADGKILTLLGKEGVSDSYSFHTDSEDDAKKWKEAIQEVVKRAPETRLENSVREGFLFKAGGVSKKSQQRRYFALTDEGMRYGKSRRGDLENIIEFTELTKLELSEKEPTKLFITSEIKGAKLYTLTCSDLNEQAAWAADIEAVLAHCKKPQVFGGRLQTGVALSLFTHVPTVLVDCVEMVKEYKAANQSGLSPASLFDWIAALPQVGEELQQLRDMYNTDAEDEASQAQIRKSISSACLAVCLLRLYLDELQEPLLSASAQRALSNSSEPVEFRIAVETTCDSMQQWVLQYLLRFIDSFLPRNTSASAAASVASLLPSRSQSNSMVIQQPRPGSPPSLPSPRSLPPLAETTRTPLHSPLTKIRTKTDLLAVITAFKAATTILEAAASTVTAASTATSATTSTRRVQRVDGIIKDQDKERDKERDLERQSSSFVARQSVQAQQWEKEWNQAMAEREQRDQLGKVDESMQRPLAYCIQRVNAAGHLPCILSPSCNSYRLAQQTTTS